jgi:hypothetical protein
MDRGTALYKHFYPGGHEPQAARLYCFLAKRPLKKDSFASLPARGKVFNPIALFAYLLG